MMRVSPRNLLGDFETLGLHFESLCVRDLKTHAEAIDGMTYHYRNKTDLETDIIPVLADGQQTLVEVKLGSLHLDVVAASLRKLPGYVDSKRMGAPSFPAIVTGTATAYRRDDDMSVIPLACLVP